MKKRPELNDKISVEEFESFYWLKEELVQFCKSKGISSQGGKLEIADRIIKYLQTGKIIETPKKSYCRSRFDWGKASLSLDTEITDNYKNTENVRSFMIEHIGMHFHFNTEFMSWVKQNQGKTLREAIEQWHIIRQLKKDNNYKTKIAPQFEYNTYVRDFLADNPDKSIRDAIVFWKLKRDQRGDNRYSKEDFLLSV